MCHSNPVGSTKRHIEFWRSITDNSEVLNWIENGVPLPFSSQPRKYCFPNRAFSKSESNFIDSEISKLLNTGAISRSVYQPHCVNPISCVPKKNGKFRLVIDLRHLNNHIKVPYFKQEGIDIVCENIVYGDEFISIDLKDGFHHCSVDINFRKFLGFQWKGKYYIFNVLPFGLNISPYYFNKTLRPVVQFCRSNNLHFTSFVDDGLLNADPAVINTQRDFLVETYNKLGLIINYEKSELVPQPKIKFIGYIIDSKGPNNTPWLYIPHDRIYKLKKDIRRCLKTGKLTARALAKICGQCVSFTKAVVPSKLLLRNLYRLLSNRSSWSDNLVLDKPSVNDLQWWLQALDNWNGKPICAKAHIQGQLFCDASDSGWGAVYEGQEAAGLWTGPIVHKSINYRELLAVLLGLKSFKDKLRGLTIQIVSDNITTVAFINNLGGNTPELHAIAKEIWSFTTINNTQISAKHLSGSKNCHADRLSRISPQSTFSWKLHPRVFRYLNTLYGPFTIDRFADIANFQITPYNSLYMDPLTSGVDALAQTDWGQHMNFVNPPFHLIADILKIIVSQKANAVIIAPFWPAQPWFPTLVKVSTAQPLRLSKRMFLGRNPEPLKNKKWEIYAWPVSGTINS